MSADEQQESEYEVCVVVTGYVYLTINAENEDDAKEDALDMWHPSDLQNCEVSEVLIERGGVYQ